MPLEVLLAPDKNMSVCSHQTNFKVIRAEENIAYVLSDNTVNIKLFQLC